MPCLNLKRPSGRVAVTRGHLATKDVDGRHYTYGRYTIINSVTVFTLSKQYGNHFMMLHTVF